MMSYFVVYNVSVLFYSSLTPHSIQYGIYYMHCTEQDETMKQHCSIVILLFGLISDVRHSYTTYTLYTTFAFWNLVALIYFVFDYRLLLGLLF